MCVVGEERGGAATTVLAPTQASDASLFGNEVDERDVVVSSGGGSLPEAPPWGRHEERVGALCMMFPALTMSHLADTAGGVIFSLSFPVEKNRGLMIQREESFWKCRCRM